ncbi:DUF5666 domain-containing protein [Spirillospora sp. NPDC048911]|uniref:DUF5666 domain-containing protein n=1 Tax=Spirillospora sp. NPDC048911 TaxID=3364527 RepID=UPI00371E0C21
MKINRKTGVAAAGAAGLLALGLSFAVPAAAAKPSPSPSTSSSAAPDRQKHRHPRLHAARAARGVHGEMTVRRDGKFVEMAWQRGQVTARTGTSLTVRSADGVSWTWNTNGDTKVRKNRAKAALDKVANGDQVMVWGDQNGTTRTAKIVRVPGAKDRPRATPS